MCMYVCVYVKSVPKSEKNRSRGKLRMSIGRCNLHGGRGRVREGVADGWRWRRRSRRRRNERADGSGETKEDDDEDEEEGEKRQRS